jgi:putative phage-type endonuclease
MYTILDIQQNTPEWLKTRHKFITASDAATLFDENEYQSPHQLFEIKLLGITPPTIGKEELFQIGHRVERMARGYIEDKYGMEFPPAVIINDAYPSMLASLDGFNFKNKIIFESKYMGAAKFERVKKGDLPLNHSYQIQTQLALSEADRCIYYAEIAGGEHHIMDVFPNRALQKEISERADLFMAQIRAGEQPSPGKGDILEIADHRFLMLKDLQNQIENLKITFDDLKDQVMSEYGQYSKVKAPGGMLIKTMSKGRVQYDSIPELKDVDTDKYRGKPSFSVTFRRTK